MSHPRALAPPPTAPTTPGRNDTPRANTAFARLPRWLPQLVVGFLVSALILSVWHALLRQQQRTIADATQAAAVQVAHEFTARLEARIQALQRIPARWGRHGGRIWLESAPREGTTVYFTITTVIRSTVCNI